MGPVAGGAVEPRLVRAAHVGEHASSRLSPKPRSARKRAICAGVSAAGGEDEQPRVGLDEGDHLLDRAAVHGEGFDIGHRPAHPRRGELEGRELRVIGDLGRRRSRGRSARRPRTTADRRWRAPRRVGPRSPCRVSSSASKGEGQAIRLASRPSVSVWWRSPPRMTSAASTTARVAGARPASPSSPMPTMCSQGMGHRGRSPAGPAASALTAAEAMAEPPRRPRRATKSQPRGSRGQFGLGFGGADEADREAEDHRRFRRARRRAVRAGGTARWGRCRWRRRRRRDGRPRARPRRPSGCCRWPAARSRHRGVVEGDDHLVVRRQVAADDPGADHLAIAQDRRAGRQRARARPRRRPAKRPAGRPPRSCRRRGSPGSRAPPCRAQTGRAGPRGARWRSSGRRSPPGRAFVAQRARRALRVSVIAVRADSGPCGCFACG